MTDEEFNRYCGNIMGWLNVGDASLPKYHRDLNQMAEVFDKLNSLGFDKQARNFQLDVFVKALPIDRAMRKFIESTKEESE